jgi:hypothetical protein
MFVILVDHAGTVEGFYSVLKQATSQKKVVGVLIFACDANDFKPAVNPILKNVPVPIFGGIFPEIIHGCNKLTRGTIVVGISTRPNVQIIPHLSDPSRICRRQFSESFGMCWMREK